MFEYDFSWTKKKKLHLRFFRDFKKILLAWNCSPFWLLGLPGRISTLKYSLTRTSVSTDTCMPDAACGEGVLGVRWLATLASHFLRHITSILPDFNPLKGSINMRTPSSRRRINQSRNCFRIWNDSHNCDDKDCWGRGLEAVLLCQLNCVFEWNGFGRKWRRRNFEDESVETVQWRIRGSKKEENEKVVFDFVNLET